MVIFLIFNELHVAGLRQRKRVLSGHDYRDENSQKTKNPAEAGFKIGRRERIRTSDPLVPNQLRYQAALLADFFNCFAWCEERDLNPHVR